VIRIEGETNRSHDPKLKAPPVASAPARAAAERIVSNGEIAELRKALADTVTVVAGLSSGLIALAERVFALENAAKPVTDACEALPSMVTIGNGSGNARNTLKLTPAEKQRAYRERQNDCGVKSRSPG
jgi:hypothetical protein